MIDFLNELSASWGNYFLLMNLQNTVFIGIALLTLYFFRQQPPKFLRAIALLALVKLFIPPVLPNASYIAVPVEMMEINAFSMPILETIVVTAGQSPALVWPSFYTIFFAIWIIGAAILLAIALYRFFRLSNIAKNSALLNIPLPNFPEDKVTLHQSETEHSPFVLGFFRYQIVFPASSKNWTERQIQAVVAHELGHVRQGDHWVNLLQLLAGIFFFFNPLVWWLNRALNDSREKVCDDAALHSLAQSPESYARCLVDIADLVVANRYRIAPGIFFSQEATRLKDRILYQLNKKGVTMKTLWTKRNMLIAALLALLALPLSCNFKSADIAGPEDTLVHHDLEGGATPFYQLTKKPKDLKLVTPVYPKKGKELGASGRIIIKALVGTDGKVEQVKVLENPSKPAKYDADFLEAVTTALKQSLFEPGEVDGKPVKAWVVIPYIFNPAPAKTTEQPPAKSGIPERMNGKAIALVGHTEDNIPIAKEVDHPKVLKSQAPEYPKSAAGEKVEGKVIVEIIVGKDGLVKSALVWESAHPDLDAAAIQAAKGHEFAPTVVDGKTVEVAVMIPFMFKLK